MLRRRPIRAFPTATAFAVALPALDLVTYYILRFQRAGAGLDAWVFIHSPALAIAGAVVPEPASLHGPPPMATFVAVIGLCLIQAALVGGVLGWLAEVARKHGGKHAL